MCKIIKQNEKKQFSKSINVLIKPTDMCNLRCKYCFQQNKGYASNNLSEATLEKFCDITFPHYDKVHIIFHGGEPTLFGKDALKKYVDVIKEKAQKYDVELKMAIQSNGTLLDDDFVNYLKNEKIGVGISFDGIHNKETRNSTEQALKSLELLKKYNSKAGVITVVSNINCHDLIKNYDYMKKNKLNLKLSAFENCIKNKELWLDIDEYIAKMKELFDYWCEDENCNINVDPFEQIIKSIKKGYSSQCAQSSCLKRWFCLEPNGDVTPCDRVFPKEYHYGNVIDMSDIRQIYESNGFIKLLTGSIKRRNKCKENCEIYQYCEGGCNNQAMYEKGLENHSGSSCKIFKELFNYINSCIKQNLSEIKNKKIKFLMERC